VFDPEFKIKLAPEFTQQPPCAYKPDMAFKWTIPSGAPIFSTQDPYTVSIQTQNVKTAAIYTLFLDNAISQGGKSWNKRVSFDVTVTNPCVNTTLFTTNTTAAFKDKEFKYKIGDPTATHKFEGVSDTISNAITTSGNCGDFVYTLTSNDTQVGTPYIQVVSLLNAKGIQIYTENEDYVGNYTLTMAVYM